MWTLGKADGYKFENGTVMQSDPIYDAAEWDKDYAALLDMSGSGRRYNNRMTLHRNSDYADPAYLNHAMSISANYSVGYSADTEYTINAGFVSTLLILEIESSWVWETDCISSLSMVSTKLWHGTLPMAPASAVTAHYSRPTKWGQSHRYHMDYT
jgi:hypothetical protein